MKAPVRVAITGAAGQIGYSLLFRIASGSMLGPDQPVILQLLEITPALKALQGVVMELQDGAFPLLAGIEISDNPLEAFKGTHYALLVGAMPRKAGMERADLLSANGGIFKPQGFALNEVADRNVKVLVVGNPANTNALIALKNAPNLRPDQFHAMMRLDHNRAVAQLADHLNVGVSQVTQMTVWGNHSSTQFPDLFNCRFSIHPAIEQIQDPSWYEHYFLPTVAKRGAAIIEAWGTLGHIFHGTTRDQPHHHLNAFAAGLAHVIDVRDVDRGFGVVDQVVQKGSVKFFVDQTCARALQLVTHAPGAPNLHVQILVKAVDRIANGTPQLKATSPAGYRVLNHIHGKRDHRARPSLGLATHQ